MWRSWGIGCAPMSNVIVWVFVVGVVLWILTKLLNSINKSGQKVRGRNRCEACKSRLRAVNGVYAGTCRKCGTRQSWTQV